MRLLMVIFLALTDARRQGLQTLQSAPETLSRNSRANKVDVYPKSFAGSVDFGHVYRDGRHNPSAKYHDDVLETDMKPERLERVKQLLKKTGSEEQWVEPHLGDRPPGFLNPRDAILHWMKVNETDKFMLDQSDRHFSKSSERAYERNKIKTVSQLTSKTTKEKPTEEFLEEAHHSPNVNEKEPDHPKYQYFTRSGFQLLSDETRYKGNWTTCKEFAKGAVFHPDDILHLEWFPFYIWSTRNFATAFIHVFTYPTKKLVQQYKDKFGPYLNIKVDWEQPKLLLKESKDMLMIAGDRKGLFYGIPYIELPGPFKRLNVTIPVIVLRMKIVDPYIAMTYCDERYAAIMAVAGTEPETDEEKIAESAALSFVGTGCPAHRDLASETRTAQFEKERKLKEERMKYIDIEKPVNTFDASQW